MMYKEDTDRTQESPIHHRDESQRGKKHLMLRNILNMIFMVGAVTGVLFYLYKDQNTGTIIILASMVFKIVECVLRFMK